MAAAHVGGELVLMSSLCSMFLLLFSIVLFRDLTFQTIINKLFNE